MKLLISFASYWHRPKCYSFIISSSSSSSLFRCIIRFVMIDVLLQLFCLRLNRLVNWLVI